MRLVAGGLDGAGTEVCGGAVQLSPVSASLKGEVVWSELTTRAHIVSADSIARWGLLAVEGDWRCRLRRGICVSAPIVLLRYGLGRSVSVDTWLGAVTALGGRRA